MFVTDPSALSWPTFILFMLRSFLSLWMILNHSSRNSHTSWSCTHQTISACLSLPLARLSISQLLMRSRFFAGSSLTHRQYEPPLPFPTQPKIEIRRAILLQSCEFYTLSFCSPGVLCCHNLRVCCSQDFVPPCYEFGTLHHRLSSVWALI